MIKNINDKINKNIDFIKIDTPDLKNQEKIVLKTQKNNPTSFGIVNIFEKGFLKNKTSFGLKNNIYWVLNIVTSNGSILNKNSHPNICLEWNNKYFGLHSSSDEKAFKDKIEYKIKDKKYYICLNRLYSLSKEFFTIYVVKDRDNLLISKKIIKKINNNLNKLELLIEVDIDIDKKIIYRSTKI